MKRALLALSLMLGVMLGQAPGPAGSEAPADNEADTPNRAVARISVINGVVSVRRGDSGDAVAAALNAPLTSTDRLLTGEGSRAEIQFDAANMIRLAPTTEVRLGDLAYHQYQVQIAGGTTLFRVMRDNEAQIEISTPSIAVRPLKRGVYRITVKPDGSTEVTVRSGEAEIASPKGTEKLGAGKTMEARGSADNPEFQITAAIAQDQFDKWNLDRDQDLEKSTSGHYVNPDINGTEELDANGRWVNDPAYGQVWVPTVDPGWAPYQVGRWVWVDYYGWTWVSGDPWGWAPYHYGRWYQGPYGWAWWPGAVYGPYYWRPALVGFFGWGGPGFGVGFGFGFGNVGWVALAPFERFSPWYGPGIYGRGFGAVGLARTNVTSIYRNARVANGVTSMSSSQFGRAGVNGASNIRANASDLARAGAVRGAVAIAPSRESTHFSNTAAASSVHSSENSHFYSSRASSASSSSHVSFDQQRAAMTRSVNPTAGARSASPASSSTAVRSAGATGPVSSSSASSGNTSAISRRPAAGATSAGSASPASTSTGAASQSSAGGWQRFNGNNSGASSQGSNGSASSANHSQAVRINPSVVQSRTSSSGSSSSSSSSGRAPSSGGGSRGASSPRSGGGGRRETIFCSASCVSRVYFFFPRGPAKSLTFAGLFFSACQDHISSIYWKKWPTNWDISNFSSCWP
jgi:hypothetical protein